MSSMQDFLSTATWISQNGKVKNKTCNSVSICMSRFAYTLASIQPEKILEDSVFIFQLVNITITMKRRSDDVIQYHNTIILSLLISRNIVEEYCSCSSSPFTHEQTIIKLLIIYICQRNLSILRHHIAYCNSVV